MTQRGRTLPALSPPIAVQILALLMGGLVAAQAVTLALSLLFPPPAAPEYRLKDIAAALRGGPLQAQGLPPLERATRTRPPDPRSAGWQTSEGARRQLAALLNADPADVRLLFYSPPPFAGAEPARLAQSRLQARARTVQANLFAPLLLAPGGAFGGSGGGPGAGGMGPGGMGPGGMGPGGMGPGGMGAGGMGPGGMGPGGGPGGMGPGGGDGSGADGSGWGGPGPGPGRSTGGRGPGGRGAGGMGRGGPGGGFGGHGGVGGPEGGRQSFDPPVAPVARGAPDGGLATGRPGQDRIGQGRIGSGLGGAGEPSRSAHEGQPAGRDGPIQTAPIAPVYMGAPAVLAPFAIPGGGFDLPRPVESEPAPLAQVIDPPVRLPHAVRTQAPIRSAIAEAPLPPATAPAATAQAQPPKALAPPSPRRSAPPALVAAEPLPAPAGRTLFGMARTPVVDGEFLAALRVGPLALGHRAPVQDPILSRWQQRVALWFVLSFALVAPLGYLLARRLAAPLAALADSAERLGRDPSAPIAQGGGSPEITGLARALGHMQARLRRHVEDRTAMVGAISHDLRTPLARLRFKLERAPPPLKASMLADLSQMEEMLNAVLVFIRDASEPASREMADLLSIVECVVDDAALVGGAATLEGADPAAVEIDISAIQRVVTNLVENALKYGGEAQVRLFTEGGEAVVEVADRGPGLPESELEAVFKPFYRSEEGRRITAKGIGLGLSVSRSIARGHGGDVALRNGPDGGLIASLRLPLAAPAHAGPARDRAAALQSAA